MRYLKLATYLLIFLLLASLFFVTPRLIKIGEISCNNQFGECSGVLESELTKLAGKSLYDAKRQASLLLKENVFVKEYTIQFKLPDRLSVYVIDRKARFALKRKGQDAFALVDKDGYSIAIVEKNSLPTVEFDGSPPNVGERVDDKNLFALKLIESMFTFYQVKVGSIENESFQVELTDSKSVVFPLEGEKDLLISSLQLILAKLENEGVAYQIIDLRFKNPVIK